MSMQTLEPGSRAWPREGISRVPAWIYSDEEIFKKEMTTFHAGNAWNYICHEAELPKPGSWRRTFVGNRPVLVTRDLDGEYHVLENRCAHRGAPVCWQQRGESADLVCPYHHWTYSLSGDLQGVTFIRGQPKPNPGMPADFDRKNHGMRKLRSTRRGGVVWATYSESAPPLEDYIGPDVLRFYDRTFSGRPMRLLGYSRQMLPCNWKLYFENSRDPYHATLLHSFFTTFGIYRADAKTRCVPSGGGRHEVIYSWFDINDRKNTESLAKEIRSIKTDFKLADMDVVTPKDEFGDGMISSFQIFPSLMFQQHANILACRHILPKSPTETELSWTYLGFADDDEQMNALRLKQGNLVGPAGYVSLDDSEVLKQMQPVVDSFPESVQVVEMHGRDHVGTSETMITESLIRAFYDFYRREMRL